MDFREATDELIRLGVPLRELATRMGLSHALLVAARLDPSSVNARKAPEGWQDAVLGIAEERSGDFFSLAKRLK